MIDRSAIPENVLDMVNEAEGYTDQEWRKVTSGWSPFYKKLARMVRVMGEQHREKLLRSQKMQDLAICDDTELALAIIALSDETLDKAINAFKPN